MDNSTKRVDPIRDKYYRPLEIADWWSDRFFYVAAALSIAALLIEKSTYPNIYDFFQIIFILSVVFLFVLSLITRLYLGPRAQERRLKDFLSTAHGIALDHVQTVGYYNNNATEPVRRLAAQLLENSFHSKNISHVMVIKERVLAVIYILIFIVAILIRATDLVWIGIVAQAVFSEQLLSRYFRIEWFHRQCERIFNDLFRLFQSQAEAQRFAVLVQELLIQYEMIKANSGTTLSGEVFRRDRQKLAEEWYEIRRTLAL